LFLPLTGDYFNKILNKQLSNLEARAKECLQSPKASVRKAVALAICTLASSSAKYNDTPIFDILPFSKPSGEWEDDYLSTSTQTHVDVLSPGLQVLNHSLFSLSTSCLTCFWPQFLFKLNFFRAIDVHYLKETKDLNDLYWYLPFILKTLEDTTMQGNVLAHRRVVAAIVNVLRKNQFLAQFVLWLSETNFITNGSIEWATSPRFEATQKFFQKIAYAS